MKTIFFQLLVLVLMFSVSPVYNSIYAQSYEYTDGENGRETWVYDRISGSWYLVSVDHGPGDVGTDDDDDLSGGGSDNENEEGGGDEDDDWYGEQDDEDEQNDQDEQDDWQDPWEDWWWDEELGWINTDNNTSECPKLSSRTFKTPNPSRLKLGIGEEVELRILNRCGASVSWSIEGKGEIKQENNRKCVVQAFWEGGSIKVTATLSNLNQDCSDCDTELEKEFEVIKPRGIFIEKADPLAGCDGDIHVNNRPSAGYWAKVYATPDDVNFYNVRFFEGYAPAQQNGAYFTADPPWSLGDHPDQTIDEATDEVVQGKGTYINYDQIYVQFRCSDERDPKLYGFGRWDIPQYYVNEKTGQLLGFDITMQTGKNEGGVNSLFTPYKTSPTTQTESSQSFRLEAATSNCQFYANPYCN